MSTRLEFWQHLRAIAETCKQGPPADLVARLESDLMSASHEEIEELRGHLAEMTVFLPPLCQELLATLDKYTVRGNA
jgi:hypothetical protein